MLRILKLRVVVNDINIYELIEKQPLVIHCTSAVTKLVVTNGFHSSRIVAFKYKPGIHFYEVESFIDNMKLLTGLVLTLFFFSIYIISGLRFFMFFANVPLLIMLYVFYIKRHSFIGIFSLSASKKQVRN